jgi:hypothetical protein
MPSSRGPEKQIPINPIIHHHLFAGAGRQVDDDNC